MFLSSLLAEIVEGESDLAAAPACTRLRDADAARLGDAFQPRGDVDAVAEDVVALDDDVADIDADAEFDARSAAPAALRSAMPR